MSIGFTKWHFYIGYGGESLYGFKRYYWTVGWHRTSVSTWHFNFGRLGK